MARLRLPRPRAADTAVVLMGVPLSVVTLTSCDDTQFGTRYAPPGVPLEDVLYIIDHSCISCHAGLQAEAGLDLSTDFCGAALGGGYVRPGDPDQSPLYMRMRSVSSPMPPTGPLPDADLELVHDWIAEGAVGCEGGVSDDPADLYTAHCAGCHGAGGEGAVGPPMAAAVAGRTPEELSDIARNGIGTTMPAAPLSESQGLALGQWLLDTFGG